jgi:hypothetical protein
MKLVPMVERRCSGRACPADCSTRRIASRPRRDEHEGRKCARGRHYKCMLVEDATSGEYCTCATQYNAHNKQSTPRLLLSGVGALVRTPASAAGFVARRRRESRRGRIDSQCSLLPHNPVRCISICAARCDRLTVECALLVRFVVRRSIRLNRADALRRVRANQEETRRSARPNSDAPVGGCSLHESIVVAFALIRLT